jgi:hypothetical protein
MSIWDTLGSVAQGLIEIGPLKIDNDTVEKIVGVGAVAVGVYAAYKVLNDKGAAENVATLTGNASNPAKTSSNYYQNETLYSQHEAWRAEAEANLARMKIAADQAEANVKELERRFGPLPQK